MRSLGKGVVAMFAILGVVATLQQLRGQGAAPLDGSNFTHIGIVVRDINKAAQMFADVYGITPPTTARVYDNNGRGLPFPPNVTGNPAAKARLMQFTVGNVRIELIEPIDGPTPWMDHLNKYGQSVHHIAFAAKDVDETIHSLEVKGGRWVMGAPGNPFGYVDMKDLLGYTIEVGRQQPPAAPAAPAAPTR